MKDDDTNPRNREHMDDPEWKAWWLSRLRAVQEDPVVRARISEAISRAKSTPEAKELISRKSKEGWVKYRDHYIQGILKRRRPKPHPKCLFTDDEVRDIRARLAAGAFQVDLAKEYGCSQPTISFMKNGKTYRHVKTVK